MSRWKTPPDANLGYICAEPARRFPDREAILDLTGAEPVSVSYSQLERSLNRVAGALSESGLVPGDRLALGLRNRREFVYYLFGAMRAALVPVPLNIKQSAEQMAYVARDAQCKAIVADDTGEGKNFAVSDYFDADLRVGLGTVPEGWIKGDEWLAGRSAWFEPPPLRPDHLSLQLYTSGSTGNPKGVLMTHSGQWLHFQDMARYYTAVCGETPRTLIAVPMFHKNGTGSTKIALAAVGAAVIMEKFQPAECLEVIATHRVNNVTTVAAMLYALLEERALIARLDFSALKAIFVGAGPSTRELLERTADVFRARIYHMYGTTESGAVLGHRPERPAPLDSCGEPLENVTVDLRDEQGTSAPDFGELWVRSPAVAKGYSNATGAEAERFRDGWYVTGDLFRRDSDGFFYFASRADDMFVTGGENVYPLEVERILAAHPAVKEVAVVSIPHPGKGRVPAAAVVCEAQRQPGVQELKDYFVANGPAYAHPREILFVDTMPLNAAGKTDKRAVAALFSSRVSRGARGAAR